MATRRRKITRSAVRRVKRRESKNAKLKTLRSRKNARKYSTAKNKRINLREMRGGGFTKPQWMKTQKEIDREAYSAKEAEENAKRISENEKYIAEQSILKKEKEEAEKMAKIEREREIEEKWKKIEEKCKSDENHRLMTDSEEAIKEIDDMYKFFRSIKHNGTELDDYLHWGDSDYIKRRKEIQTEWEKTKTPEYLENLKKLLEKLSETKNTLTSLNNDCRRYLRFTFKDTFDKVFEYGGVTIDTIWDIMMPIQEIPCRYRARDPDCM
jgi:hypothetical protein